MIGTARLYRCLVLLLRVSARHGDPLSLLKPIPRTLPQMTPSTVQKGRLPTVVRASCRSDRAS
jgi:hypothetical protein